MKKRIALIVSFFLIMLAVPPAVSAMSEDKALRFDADGNFKILVIADIQDGANVSKYAMELIEKSLDAEQPDLVVLLGDNIFGRVLSLRTKENVKQSIDTFMAPIVERSIPFCPVFGNHDGEAAMTNEEQLEYYMTFPGCLAKKGDVSGVGNYHVTIKDRSGDDAVNLVFFDSGSYAPKGEGKYAYVMDDQIAWYQSMSNELEEKNGGTVPSYIFQHMPVCEIYDVLQKVDRRTDGAVRGHGAWSDSHYILNPDLASGYLGEGPCPPDVNNGQFESLVEQQNAVAMFFGHDHVNDFVAHYKGIDLVQSPGVGVNAYGNGYKRGVRVVELSEVAPETYETRMVYFDDLTDTKIPWHLQYMGSYVFGIVVAGVAALLLIATVAVVVGRKIKKRKARAT